MYKKLITIAFIIFWLSGFSQGYLIIDTNQTNLSIFDINIELVDTTMNGEVVSSAIDLDGDNTDDCVFTMDCWMWSYWWDYYYIEGINLEFVIDPNHIDSVFQEGEWSLKTFTIVEKYEYGDTIFSDENFQSSKTHFIDCYSVPSYYYHCINDFMGINYIAIRKYYNGQLQLGWIKIEVPHIRRLHILQAGVYDPNLQIRESFQKAPLLYPNPSNNYVSFENPDYSYCTVADLQGKILLYKPISPGKQSINISMLSPGIYIICFTNEDEKIFSKLLVN